MPPPQLRASPKQHLRSAAEAAARGLIAVKYPHEIGTGHFDAATQTIQGAQSSTLGLKGSTEEAQF